MFETEEVTGNRGQSGQRACMDYGRGLFTGLNLPYLREEEVTNVYWKQWDDRCMLVHTDPCKYSRSNGLGGGAHEGAYTLEA